MKCVEKFKKKYSLNDTQLAKMLGMSQSGVWKWRAIEKDSEKVLMMLEGLEARLKPVYSELIKWEKK